MRTSLLIICSVHTQDPPAQQGSLSQTTYLRQLYSIMTELSQVGQDVSKKAVKLQSAPEEKCLNEFGFYQGIISSLRSKLSITIPPQRLQPLHVKSMDGLSNYLTGLNLYSSACLDKDYAMKANLVDRGSSCIYKAGLFPGWQS